MPKSIYFIVAIAVAGVVAGVLYTKPNKTGKHAVMEMSTAAPEPLTPAQLCVRDLKNFVRFKDPDSVHVTSAEHSTLTNSVLMLVNAKNSMGGYTGDIVYTCNADQDQQRVLSITDGAIVPR